MGPINIPAKIPEDAYLNNDEQQGTTKNNNEQLAFLKLISQLAHTCSRFSRLKNSANPCLKKEFSVVSAS